MGSKGPEPYQHLSCSVCACTKGLCQARRLQGGKKVCSDQVPLQTSRTVKCVRGNRVMEFREFPSLPNVPSFHPKAGWHPGIKEGGGPQWPYSHHQATDHPGHHPDSLGDDPKRQPEGRSLRSWDNGPSGTAVHLSLGVGGDHHPRLRLRSAGSWGNPEPVDRGPRRGSRLRTEAGGRARSSAPRRRILAAQSHNSCRGEPFVRPSRAPLLVSGPGGRSGPPLSRTVGVAEHPTTCTGLRGGVCNSLESCTEPGPAQP